MAIGRPTLDFRTRQTVVKEISAEPYLGFENTNDLPNGWRYDIKRWCSPFDLRLPSLPKLNDPSTQGVSESVYFRSGVGSVQLGDLDVLGIYSVQSLFSRSTEDILDGVTQDSERQWIPNVRHGLYFRYKTDYFYYSDNSYVQYIDTTSNRDSRNYLELEVEPSQEDPILAATFTRDPITKEASYYTRVSQRIKFTGTYVDNVEQETVSSAGYINWSVVDTTKKEFIVDKTIDGLTRLFFNDDYTETHGVVPVVYEDLAACIYLGATTSEPYQLFHLPHFPVLADSTFHLYVATNSTWVEWERVSTWWDLVTTDYTTKDKFYLDKDLGIVYFGSSADGGIPTMGRHIVVAYKTTLRIEYEEKDNTGSILATKADVNPVTQPINQGFVCISHSQIEPASITLSISKDIISGTDLYGPIYAGSDYAILRATVKSVTNTPVPNVEVSFTMNPIGIGFLDGSNESTSVTDPHGHAYSSYQPPATGEDLGHYSITAQDSTDPNYPSDRELIVYDTNASLLNAEDEIYIYQVLKDDLILGYKTVGQFLLAMFQQNPALWVGVTTTFPAWLTETPDLTLPPNYPSSQTNYEQWKLEMIAEYDLVDFIEPDVSSPSEPVAGRKVVVYQISDVDNYYNSAINPVTGEYGAIMPVRPLSISQLANGTWRLVYPAGSLPSTGSGSAIGSYWVVASRVVEFQASCWSPYYNRRIYSNKVLAKISLPDYMLGVYINNLGQKIPFGWKIIGDDDNVAAALNGATFITINPFSGPYPIIDLVDNTGATGDWADAPFRVANFVFNVDIP